MSTHSSRFLVLLTMVLSCAMACSSADGPAHNLETDPALETVIKGRAPLNAGGTVQVTTHEGDRPGATYESEIKDDGSFLVSVRGAHGKMTLEAQGGSYIEPANGSLIHHAGQKLHAALLDAKQIKNNDVAITPWTEIAYARGVENYAENLKTFTEMLSCQGAPYTELLRTPPALPVDGIQSLTSPNALSYIYMGAFSQLADDLSEAYGVQAGTRLTSMRLAKVLAEDFADGRIDGKNMDGGTVYLLDGQPLPPDVLRQQLAQSTRRFLKTKKERGDARDWGNDSTIGEAAMLDFLRCISESTDPQLGPPGEPLDRTGPALAVTTPEPESYISSAQDVVCEAHDPSGVKALSAVLLREEEELSNALGTPSIVVGPEARRHLTTPLRIEKVATGDASVRCDATDRWGNTSTVIVPFHINRGGIAPQNIVHADDTNHLAGRIELTCDCQEDTYSERCELIAPEGERGIALIEQGDRKSTYAWDTHKVLDGVRILTCANTTRGLPRPLVQPKSVRVKNHQNGIANGAVYLDTPVSGMQVAAYAFENGEIGRQIGNADTDDDGQFSFPISTEYRGPVLLRADYSRSPSKLATFHNVPLDTPMSCTNAVLTLLIEHYEPGEPLSGLSINVVSTMHEALAGAFWRLGKEQSFYAAAQNAYALVANYVSGSGKTFDPRRTWVANLSHPDRADHDQRVMGLFHTGLSRLAVDRSLEYCQGSEDCITISEIVEAMRRDLSDGKLDGQASGAQVYMPFRAPLTADFFRIDLARAIRRWLDKTPYIGTKSEPVNKSGLTVATLTARSPVLQNFAKHHSPLFNNRPGVDYDGKGPRIEWRACGADQNLLDLTRMPLGATTFRLVVKATDETGVSKIEATLNNAPLTNDTIHGDAGNGEYVVHTGDLQGEQQIVILAWDAQGTPPTIEYVNFNVDRILPEITLGRSEIWISNGAGYRLTGSVTKPHAMAQVFVDDAPTGEPFHVDAQGFDIPLPLVCGASRRIELHTWDLAGNRSSALQLVHCDSDAPTIRHLESWFTNVKDGQRHDLTHRLLESPNPTYADLLDAEATVTIEPVWSLLDDDAGPALPTLNFAVSDTVGNYGVATPELHIAYKYIYRGIGGTQTRDWTDLQCSPEGLCKLPFAYQSMLPDSIRQHPTTTARGLNFIARSTESDIHTVLVKVTDKAGNVTTAEWSFRMRLFAPPVSVECAPSAALTEFPIVGSSVIVGYAHPNAALFTASVKWDVPKRATSLVPDDVGYVFEFADAIADWKIEKEWTETRITKHIPRHGATNACRENPRGWTLKFDDEISAQALERATDYPAALEIWNHADMQTHKASQRLTPLHRRIALRANQTEVNQLLTAESPRRFSDGKPMEIAAATNISGKTLSRFSLRTGNEYNQGFDCIYGEIHQLEQQNFLANLLISRDAYKPRLVSALPGTPGPLGINYAANCEKRTGARWEDGNTAKIVAP